MVAQIVTVFLFCSTFIFFASVTNGQVYSPGPNYYWREYNGIVPQDAVEGGRDNHGQLIYVGQGLFPDLGLIPGTLHPGSTNITITAYNKVRSTTRYVKILCSPNPTLFKWILTAANIVQSLATKCQLVLGGAETNNDLHIGRTVHEGSLEIGKVFNYPPPELCLPINRGSNEIRYKNYEILTYNCAEESTCP